MALLPTLIGFLLLGCFCRHPQEERATAIPVVVNRPRNQGNLDLQLGYPSPDRPDVAWITADGALNPGLEDRFSPEIPKTSEPTRELLCTATCFYSGDLGLRLRYGKGLRETVLEPRRVPNARHHLAAVSYEQSRCAYGVGSGEWLC